MIDKEFQNKCVLVTGGTQGIGRSICIELAKKGADVVFTYRKDDKNLKSIKILSKKNNYNLYGYKISTLKDKGIKKLLQKIKKKHKVVNFLINNIGDAIMRTQFKDSKDSLWIKSLEINLMSAIRITRNLLNLFNNNELKSIVNVGSVAGKTFGQGDSLHYGVAKSAELLKTRVNCVAPNAVDTNFQKRLSSKKRIKNIIKKNMAGRLASTQEVAELIVFLCSNKASYINGEIIYLTGGLK